ncbi:MAG: hypothetical protein OEW36_02605, partial [Hylemonella sp.]|nr:hypothetical protein [Hylemonella sp.]
IQVKSGEELQALKPQASEAELALLDEGKTTCCHVRSDKYWVTDPQGLAWEQLHTLDNIPAFRESSTVPATACCTPTAAALSAPCCGPTAGRAAASPMTCSGSSCLQKDLSPRRFSRPPANSLVLTAHERVTRRHHPMA